MKIKKSIYAIILGSFLIFSANAQQTGYISSGGGFDAGIIIPDNNLHPSFGWGAFLDFGFGIGNYGEIHIHPNIESWVSGYENNYNDITVFETAINADLRYYFPLPRSFVVRPFVGNGLAIVTLYENKKYNSKDISDINLEPGFNIFTGIEFNLSENLIGFTELKGKFGEYDLLKMTFGITFPF